MNSMTAFGQGEASLPDLDVSVEIRTVNSRYLDIALRLPKELSALEPELRKLLKKRFARGRLEVFVNLNVQSSNQFELSAQLVDNYLNIARQASEMGIQGELTLSELLQLPGVVSPRAIDLASANLREAVLEALEQAATQIAAGRSKEGQALKDDLGGHLASLRSVIQKIEPMAARITELYREKLAEKISRLGTQGDLDETRLAQEVLYFSERADIGEEITRLKSHLERFQEVVESGGKSIGKNLDFLCQEMNREMNTIVSKSSIAAVSEPAVEGKVIVEKIREQVQNVE